jgi:hypothetical protein
LGSRKENSLMTEKMSEKEKLRMIPGVWFEKPGGGWQRCFWDGTRLAESQG